jgi:tRNA dimethylallyltransferase
MNRVQIPQSIHPVLIALVGPTASGKTDVAIRLARKLEKEGRPVEIISADSMQVYRGMDIGTAKPGLEERREIAHHLIDVARPTENYNVSRFREEASQILEQLLEAGKGAIVTGGTGLYVKALVDGLNEAPAGDPEIRQRLEEMGRREGPEVLYERLQAIDPEACEKIHPNNLRRTVRALEVYEISGRPFSWFHKVQESPPWKDSFQWFGLKVPFAVLDERIEARTEIMFQKGLVEEVKKLLAAGCGPEHTAMQGLGYKEVAEGLRQGWSEEEMKELVSRKTKRYARRQMTFWRPEKRIQWMSSEEILISHGIA